MPIEPNIAMGVRPIEQPNMLGQLAQAMAIRQAQQAYESDNALRDFYSKGGDLSTAEGKRQLMSRAPTAGMKLIGQQSEIAARDLGSTEKAIKLYKDQVGGVTDPASAASLLKAVYTNPLTRPFVESMAPLDKALAKIPTDAAGLEQWKRGFGLTADKLFVDANTLATNQARIQAAGISAGPANARLNWEKQQQAEVDALMRGGAPSAVPAVSTGAAPATAGSAPTGASAPANALAAPSVNALASTGDVYAQISAIDAKIAQLMNLGNPKALSLAQGLTAQRNALLQSAKNEYGGATKDMSVPDPSNPNQRITVTATRDKYGNFVPAEIGQVPLSVGNGPTAISPTVARPPAAAPVWNEKTGVWMSPPSPENPKGTAIDNPEVKNIVQTRAANKTLEIAGFDPKSGKNEISELIKKSTSGLGENWANKAWSAISGTGSSGAEAIAKLETRAHEMTLGLAPNGSLGAGFSNEDRNFMLNKLGDVANPNKPMNIRLAAWDDVMERAARNANVPYKKSNIAGVTSDAALPKGFKLD